MDMNQKVRNLNNIKWFKQMKILNWSIWGLHYLFNNLFKELFSLQ